MSTLARLRAANEWGNPAADASEIEHAKPIAPSERAAAAAAAAAAALSSGHELFAADASQQVVHGLSLVLQQLKAPQQQLQLHHPTGLQAGSVAHQCDVLRTT